MANSIVKFYKVDFPVYTDENSRIDDLADYLETKNKWVMDDFQYIRHDLNISIKINAEQRYVDNFNYNYCEISNYPGTEPTIYYYISKVVQISPNTLQIDLNMDTVNSLVDPREFSPETEITRLHEDRFYKSQSWSPSAGGTLARHISRSSEGIMPDKLKSTDTVLYDGNSTSNDLDWYLIYQSRNVPTEETEVNNPVETFLVANERIKMGTTATASSITYTANDLDEGKYYYFTGIDNLHGEFTINHASSAIGSITINFDDMYIAKADKWESTYNYVSSTFNNFIQYLCIRKRNGVLEYNIMYKQPFILSVSGSDELTWNMFGSAVAQRTGNALREGSWLALNSITFTSANFFRVSNTNYLDYINESEMGIIASIAQKAGIYVGDYTTQVVSSIKDVDRTDSRLIKIIKLPYCPIAYTKTGTAPDISYSFGDDWQYELGMVKYNKTDLPTFERNSFINLNLLDLKRYIDVNEISPRHSKIKELESKLYNSDFKTHKLVYDSFVKDIKLENIEPNIYTTSVGTTLDFKPTSTINSRFGFKLNIPAVVGTYEEDEDFGDILLVNRNNEETLLNNEYINYIKYGKAIDDKANALATQNSIRNAGFSTASTAITTIAGIVAALTPGGQGLGATLIGSSIANGIGAVDKWVDVSKDQEARTNAMNAKLTQLAQQSSSTAGSDDVDLMSWYSNNRLHYITYKPTDFVSDKIYRVLDLTGYTHNEFATPDVDSRYWYNYVQCTPDIPDELTKTYKAEWITDLKEKYKQGVSVFHHHDIGTETNVYEFDRRYENYETWIIEE